MPRRPRFNLPGIPQHIVQRGNNRDSCFFTEQDRRQYLEDLAESAEKYLCEIHAYVLMTNHVHLLVTPKDKFAVSQMMQALGRRYVYYVNHRYGRSGTLWEGRYRSSLVDSEAYLLACMRYIELNPVRAGMVAHPAEYQWSSYLFNAQYEASELICPHPLYLAIDGDETRRKHIYRDLCLADLDKKLINEIRESLNHDLVLGRSGFKDQIEQETGRQSRLGVPGRPCVDP
jgi:putative transposase